MGVNFMHERGKLNKIIHIILDQVFLSCSWIDKCIRFIAHRPIFDGMKRGMRVFACTLVATRIIQKIYPAARYGRPAGDVRQVGGIALNRA